MKSKQLKNESKIDRYFTSQMFRRQLFPALVSAVVLSLGDTADALVLGNRVGYIGLAAIGLTMPVSQIFNVIMNAFGIGGSVSFAQKMAQGKRKEALEAFQGVFCTTALIGVAIAVVGNLLMTPLLRLLGTSSTDGALFTASLTYLRILLIGTPMLFLNYVLNYYLKNDNMEKEASFAFTVGNSLDVCLNVVLVLFLNMGVAGASLATVIGQTIGLTITLVSIFRKDGVLKIFPLRPNFSEVFDAFRAGFFSSIEFLYSMAFLLIANNLLIQSAGGIGVAIFDVVLNVTYIMINLYDAVAKSLLPVISTYYGERNEDGMNLALRLGIRYSLVIRISLCALIFVFSPVVCRLFGLDTQELLNAGTIALRLFALSIPLAGIAILLENYYEACGQERLTLILASLRGLLQIPLALFLARFPSWAFWAVYPLNEALTLLIFHILSRRLAGSKFDSERVYRKTLYSRSSEISETSEEISEFCARWDATPKQQYMASMALEELCVATMDNGFQGKDDGFIQITLIALDDQTFELHIRDNADSFNPLAMEMKGNSLDDENLAALGVVAIKKKAKGFSYRHFQGFNTVIICL